MTDSVHPTQRVVRGKPVFVVVPSVPHMRKFIQQREEEKFDQNNRQNLADKDEAYTPVSRNKMDANLFHLRVYKSPTSAFYLPADRS